MVGKKYRHCEENTFGYFYIHTLDIFRTVENILIERNHKKIILKDMQNQTHPFP